MTFTADLTDRPKRSGDGNRRSSSILQHDSLPEDRDVGCLHRDGGVWDWDEHRALYDLAAGRAMALFGDLRALPGLRGAISRGLFSVATSNDEDHFAVRMDDGRGGAYKWPTVPSAEESKDVVLIGAFLGAKRRGEPLLEPQDIPLAIKRARIIGRNVPVLVCAVTEGGLRARRFQLHPRLFARLMAVPDNENATAADVEFSRWVTLLAPRQLSARFKEIAQQHGWERRPRLFPAVFDLLKRVAGGREL